MDGSYWTRILDRRIDRRRALAASGGASIAAALLAACGSGDGDAGGGKSSKGLISEPEDTTKQAKRTGTMKDRSFGDPPTLDPFTANNPWNTVGPMALSALLQFKPGYMKPTENEVIGDIAESWEWADDGLTVLLKLRQGVKWHNKPPLNGRAFEMEDVLFSWERFVAKSSTRGAIANAADPGAPVLSLTAPDSRTIAIKLKEPIVFAPGLFTSSSSGGVNIMPKETDKTFDIRNDMIGTGPWVMTNYTPSVGFTLKRHPEYWDKDYALVEQVDLPIITEYATALSQFKAGNLYFFGSSATAVINPEDVLSTKREEPRIKVYQGDLRNAGSPVARLIFGWKPDTTSPFRDERLRQAFSMAFDRDTFLDVFFNVSNFEREGLPVETRWGTAVNPTFEGWWLDPKSKDFGANAKYFEHNVSEAKKLVAAAAIQPGTEILSSYISGSELGNAPKQAEVLNGMIREIGVIPKVNIIDYLKEYVPQYRDGRGQFEGYAYKSTAGGAGAGDAVASLSNEYWTKGGTTWHGFSASGKNDQSGDPQIESLIERARVERDTDKRKSLVNDIQRTLAKPMYTLPLPGFGTGFTVAWPAIGNFRVFQGGRLNYRLWIDDTKAPIAKT